MANTYEGLQLPRSDSDFFDDGAGTLPRGFLRLGLWAAPTVTFALCLLSMLAWGVGESPSFGMVPSVIVAVVSAISLLCAMAVVRSGWVWLLSVALGMAVALPTIAGLVHEYNRTDWVPAALGLAIAATVCAAFALEARKIRSAVFMSLAIVIWLSLGFGVAARLGVDVSGLYGRNFRDWFGLEQLAGIANHPNILAPLAGAALLLQSLALPDLRRRPGVLLLAVVFGPVASAAALIWTQSRGGIISTIAAVVLVLLAGVLRHRVGVVAGGMSLLFVLGGLLPVIGRMEPAQFEAGEEPFLGQFLSGRWFAWYVADQEFSSNELIGTGPYAYSARFWSEWPADSYWKPVHAHNQVWESLVLLGIIGLIILAVAMVLVAVTAARVRFADRGWLVGVLSVVLVGSVADLSLGASSASATLLLPLLLAAVTGSAWRIHLARMTYVRRR